MATETTEGLRLLQAWLARPGNSQNALAKTIGIYQSSVSEWVRAVSRPESEHRDLLEVVTHGAVPALAWRTREERERLDLARRSMTGTDDAQ